MSVTRISGINSGMDIDGLVTKLMTSERSTQTKLKQQVQTLTWKQDAYRSVNTLAASLRDMAFNLRFSSNWAKTAATTSDPTKITVTSDPNAQTASHQITVTKLVAGTSNSSASGIYAAAGKSGTLDPNDSLQNQASNLGFSLTSNTVVINGKTITVDPSKSLNDFINQVNTSGAGVTMTYDSYSDKVVLATNSIGASAKIDFTGTSGFDNSVLKMVGLSSTTKTGNDAIINIDGLDTTRPSNNFSLNGVNYTLLGTTTQAVSVNVAQDTSAIKKSITDFVDKYNTLITTLSAKTNEPKFRDYAPLTDDQKSAMKDSDITLWNQKAQSGLLHNDDLLKKAYSDLRLTMMNKVTNTSGSYDMLADIGITTGSYNINDPTSAGKLIIDQNKLDAALATDPNGVVNLFANIGADGSTDRGIAQQIDDVMTNFVSSLTKRAGVTGNVYDNKNYQIGDQVASLELKITEWDAKLSKKEDYYYSMFSKMDTAIGNANAQMSWLQSQMG
ncbi:flagellar filament capping protein FliD [Paenibacillus sp. P26]|nr:flagellar filament capping protein FliD [Paenibacillus sp. P26]UUZ91209.1 flagellar filament capping protein FliD [Paenibacillus sp. P25]